MGRVSPFLADVPLDAAVRAWHRMFVVTGCASRLPHEPIDVPDALARVTALPVWAQRSSPAYDAAAMDGIAVTAGDTIGAAPTRPLALSAAQHDVVDTGDAMPAGRDAVIMREHLQQDGAGVLIRAAAPPHQHVRSAGEDIAAGELLLPPGHRLRPVDLAAIAAAGVTTVSVHRRPIVAILPTGDEIRPVGTPLQPGEIADTNSLMLAAQVREAGGVAAVHPIAPDDPGRITDEARAAAGAADVLLILAGSSAGRDDHTAEIVAALGGVAAHGIAVRPGHPVVLGVARTGGRAIPVVGVPGYPVSAALTFDILIAPVLAALMGTAPATPPTVAARTARKIASVLGMDDWVRVRLGAVGEAIVAAPLPRGAGVLTSLVRADGLLVVPAGEEGVHAGSEVEVQLLTDLDVIRRSVVVVGSHDLVLDLLAARLQSADPRRRLVSGHVGSLGGLTALRDGLCHIAGAHLLDPRSGRYTLPWLERLMPDTDLAVVRLVERQQGLIVAPGNPLGLTGLADVIAAGARYANRQPGAGTRVLLDHLLERAGLAVHEVSGYNRQEPTHLGVAAAVAAGSADCGLGILAAAKAFDLDFVPLAEEPFDLVMARGSLEDDRVAAVLALLDDADLRRDIDALGGYDTARTGERIR